MKTLKELRGERSVRDVAQAVGISHQTLYDLEAGRVMAPQQLTVEALSSHYGLDTSDIENAIISSIQEA